jgi:hypothetical protein
MEALGAAGAIVGIIDVVARSIFTLAEIRRQFKDAELTICLLSGQLTAVQVAVKQIQGLLNSDRESHYLLTLNLDVSIKCCKLLIEKIDEQLQNVSRKDGENHTTFGNRAKMVLESKGIEECLTRLDRQINALNLIITTLNRYVPWPFHLSPPLIKR